MYGHNHNAYDYRHPAESGSSSSTSPQQAATPHQTHGTGLIGKPIHFTAGQFVGRTIRAELHEVQKADLGRKYAKVDRRPLDPPPVVLLRLFDVYNVGTERQSEKEITNYDEIQSLGLVCTVDLFPVPNTESSRKDGRKQQSSEASFVQSHGHGQGYGYGAESSTQRLYTFVPNNVVYPAHGMGSVPPLHVPSHPYAPPHSTHDVVFQMGDHQVTESSKLTQALVGATFVQPSSVEYQGRKSILFVFADLAVKIEGTFILRYRFFDLFSKAFDSDLLTIQAECYGGCLRVYSTKEFPGLQASTELTKHLARWGVRLNIRETERKRRKKGEHRSTSPLSSPTVTTARRKIGSSSDDND